MTSPSNCLHKDSTMAKPIPLFAPVTCKFKVTVLIILLLHELFETILLCIIRAVVCLVHTWFVTFFCLNFPFINVKIVQVMMFQAEFTISVLELFLFINVFSSNSSNPYKCLPSKIWAMLRTHQIYKGLFPYTYVF